MVCAFKCHPWWNCRAPSLAVTGLGGGNFRESEISAAKCKIRRAYFNGSSWRQIGYVETNFNAVNWRFTDQNLFKCKETGANKTFNSSKMKHELMVPPLLVVRQSIHLFIHVTIHFNAPYPSTVYPSQCASMDEILCLLWLPVPVSVSEVTILP